MIPIELILKEFGEKLVDDLRAALKKDGVGYGGQDSKLAASIKFKIILKNEGIAFQLTMPNYAEYVDKGRRQTKKKGDGSVRKKIEEWARAKNIIGQYQEKELQERIKKQNESKRRYKQNSKKSKAERAKRVWKTLKKMPFNRAKKQLAFAIASKIHKKGYEGNNFFTNTINDGRLDILATDLKDYGIKNFKFEL